MSLYWEFPGASERYTPPNPQVTPRKAPRYIGQMTVMLFCTPFRVPLCGMSVIFCDWNNNFRRSGGIYCDK